MYFPVNYLVSIRKLRLSNYLFPVRKAGIFCPGKKLLLYKLTAKADKIKGLLGGVHWYAAQASPRIDAAKADNPASSDWTA
jgi:hypothetical protein